MLGEALNDIRCGTLAVEELRGEMEMFRLANEDNMNEWLYQKKMAEYEERLAKLEAELNEAQEWYEWLIERESASDKEEFDRAYEESELLARFAELSKWWPESN